MFQDASSWDDETVPLHMDGGPVANGTDSLHSSGRKAEKGQLANGGAVPNGDGYLQAPGQEEDDGRGLLGGEPSNAGSIEVRAAGQSLLHIREGWAPGFCAFPDCTAALAVYTSRCPRSSAFVIRLPVGRAEGCTSRVPGVPARDHFPQLDPGKDQVHTQSQLHRTPAAEPRPALCFASSLAPDPGPDPEQYPDSKPCPDP